ncbi:four-helix bundle copper-binding protein [Paludisphaera mucosa]|uniref:Four-helix bundle copper-binding protein n=1 Tax=Paludisphaera mucosa TaxID=3030827 RepID=A0ABT6F859_9BACT|nr:four-helix bundle copper-binding protein [Paludisphaera mucosa]MDG3003671.1 four-helix bundle copper-binding protein [Paludisphaera mucosa]
MVRRELLTVMGAGAAGLMMTGSARADDQDEKKKEHHAHMKTMGECAMICDMTSAHCLMELGKDATENRDLHAKVAAITNDCQTFCVQAVTLMARHSLLAMHAHKACADACRDCAAACDKGQGEMMKKCAEICRECERACRACCSATA